MTRVDVKQIQALTAANSETLQPPGQRPQANHRSRSAADTADNRRTQWNSAQTPSKAEEKERTPTATPERDDHDRRFREDRSAHRTHRQRRARRRRRQAAEAHARRRRARHEAGIRRHQVGLRSRDAERPAHGHGREPRAAQDEVRDVRRHGARGVRRCAGSVPALARLGRGARDEGEVRREACTSGKNSQGNPISLRKPSFLRDLPIPPTDFVKRDART